jgi:hypothetical protein
MTRRSLLLAAGLLVSLAWSAWLLVQGGDDGVVQATARAASRTSLPREAGATRLALANPAPARPAPLAELDADERPAPPQHARNLFAEYSYEPPKPKAVAPPPEPPHAPPLPWTYAGRLEIDGRTSYLLDAPGKTLALAVGEADADFQLLEASGQQLTFLHGPTGLRVPLTIPTHPGPSP